MDPTFARDMSEKLPDDLLIDDVNKFLQLNLFQNFNNAGAPSQIGAVLRLINMDMNNQLSSANKTVGEDVEMKSINQESNTKFGMTSGNQN